MKIVELKDLQREEGQIFYIRKYTGTVSVELPTNIESLKIKFTIEIDPLSNKKVDLELLNQINYPVLPLKKSITEFILNEDSEGRLPC